MGFTFDDVNAAKGKASTLADMRQLIAQDGKNKDRIQPYLGGEEINNSPRHTHHRYAINFFDMPLDRGAEGASWSSLNVASRQEQLRRGRMAFDYPSPVACDWPERGRSMRN